MIRLSLCTCMWMCAQVYGLCEWKCARAILIELKKNTPGTVHHNDKT